MKNKNAFTLVELMISIALVLVLIIGVNRVFKYTTDTVGTEAAISSAMRDLRAAERTLRHDTDMMVSSSEQPAIVIRSHVVYAFRNQQDALSDADGLPETDVDPTNPASTINYAAAGNEALPTARRHRLDTLSFFARDISQPYKRQTGDPAANSGTLIYNDSSAEAWISLGPLWLPDNAGTFDATATPPATYPGVGTIASSNPNNYYASQWLYGRQTILLKSFANMTIGEAFLVSSTGSGAKALSPLQWDTPVVKKISATGAGPALAVVQEAACDLANTTISDYRNLVGAADPGTWWTALCTTGATGAAPQYLFQADPAGVKLAGGMTGTSAAKASNVFISSCSQFIVEYAGDFVTQDPNSGAMTVAQPDGITDFAIIPATGGNPIARRMVQWYGMDRDTSGNAVAGPDGLIATGSGDVRPVQTIFGNSAAFAFEKQIPSSGSDYITAWRAGDLDGSDAAYAGKPRKPTMIRIIIQIADSAGRLTDGQNFEYVFAVK
jgi:prepilin-type N-terminal cleavage/methylation domain-containing protein